MVWIVLLIITMSIYRAKRRKTPWSDILSFPSQWLNWALLGNDFEETTSARVGINRQQRARPEHLWRGLEITLNTVFLLKERDHCTKSIERVRRPPVNVDSKPTG